MVLVLLYYLMICFFFIVGIIWILGIVWALIERAKEKKELAKLKDELNKY